MKLKAAPEDFVVREHITNLQLAEGQYSLYLLRKKGWNTEDCLQWLAKKLQLKRKDIGCCGNKDRHALTEQYITIYNGPKGIGTPPEWNLTYLGQRKEQLRLGMHERNCFIITVHEYTKEPPKLTPVKNFFGEQRFGDNTEVGFALLRKDYRKACELLKLPHDTDLVGALRTIPKHTLLLYVHAAQSKLWNEAIEGLLPAELQVPLPGFAIEGDEFVVSRLRAVLEKRGLSEESFIDRSFQELSLEGGFRQLLQDVQGFSAGKVAPDAIRLCFSLGKGQYATETVRQLL